MEEADSTFQGTSVSTVPLEDAVLKGIVIGYVACFVVLTVLQDVGLRGPKLTLMTYVSLPVLCILVRRLFSHYLAAYILRRSSKP